MKLATSFVLLRKVKPTASRWHFSEPELETAAQLILEVGGVINPIVIRRESSSESYAVLHGNFEYYAMARAHQMDSRRCESIEAFIVESRDEPVILKQVALFRNQVGAKVMQSRLRYGASDRAATSPNQWLDVFNHAMSDQLLAQIKRIGLAGRNAEKVVEAIEQERQRHPFFSLKDVVMRVKGLSYEKMIDLVEAE